MGARRAPAQAPCVPICLLAPWVGSVRGAPGLRLRQEPPNASLSLRRQRGTPGHVRMFCGGFSGVSQLPVGAVLGGRKSDLGMFCVPPSRGCWEIQSHTLCSFSTCCPVSRLEAVKVAAALPASLWPLMGRPPSSATSRHLGISTSQVGAGRPGDGPCTFLPTHPPLSRDLPGQL